MKTTTVTVLAAAFVFTGCVGGPEDDICTRAAMHLESCMGSAGGVLDTCSPGKAQRILSTNCTTLQNGTRSTSFNLFDWLGNLGNNNNHEEECHPDDPWCHDHHGEEPWDDHEGPSGWEHGKECYCDNKCHIFDDCCGHCQHWNNDHHNDFFGGGLEEPGGGYGNQEGGWCSHQGGTNWRRCRQCGWQFCLANGQWAPCQKPEDNKFSCGGGAWCGGNGYCHY